MTEVRAVGERQALCQRVEFATEVNPVARIAYGLYRGGFLRAVSVGFITRFQRSRLAPCLVATRVSRPFCQARVLIQWIPIWCPWRTHGQATRYCTRS